MGKGTLEELLTYEQLATKLQMSPGTLRNWVSEGFIPCVRVGRHVRFIPREIERWLDKRRQDGRVRRRIDVRCAR